MITATTVLTTTAETIEVETSSSMFSTVRQKSYELTMTIPFLKWYNNITKCYHYFIQPCGKQPYKYLITHINILPTSEEIFISSFEMLIEIKIAQFVSLIDYSFEIIF